MNFDVQTVKQNVESISAKANQYHTPETLKQIFSLIDLTSLSPKDHSKSIVEIVEKVNQLKKHHPNMPQVAAICIYPNYAETVKKHLNEPINIASVAAGFPSSQTFLSVKMAEAELTVAKGANEIDIVIPLGSFLKDDYETVANQIIAIKSSIGKAHLKVILESGLMPDLESIYRASILAINSGADFIKTSTGKESPAATLESVYVICQAIKFHYEKTGKKIGLKPAGGISTPEEAMNYYAIVAEVLGKEWLNNELFRIGASRLANHLIKEIYRIESNTEIENYF